MSVEVEIHLNKFKERPYQTEIVDALEVDGYKKLFIVLPRRSGKDLVCFNLMLGKALERVGLYLYVLPTFSSARRIIWDNITIEGERLLDYIPPQLIESRNEQMMRIRLKNGSIMQVLGSDSYDNTIVGSNPIGIVFSEMSLSDVRAYYLSRPILNANDGWCIINGTPRGHNSFYELFKIAKANPEEWYVCYKTIEDTKHVPMSLIQKEIDSGEISYDLARQEYWCDWSCGQAGSYYSDYLDKMRLQNRISMVPYESNYKVNTSWDLGVHDATFIVFWQQVGTSLRIIDCYTNTDKGLDHYAKILDQRGYTYGTHIAPHDISVRELGAIGAMSRLETARDLGIDFTVAPRSSLEDGIEAVRTTFSRLWIDEVKCAPLLKALEEYRRVYDPIRKKYEEHPYHNWASNGADAVRYMCLSLPYTQTGSDETAEEHERRYRRATGQVGGLSPVFRDDIRNY